MKRMLLMCCALALCLPAASTFAAEEAAGERRSAEPVVVTAGRIEEKAKNITQSMTLIPQEEIQKNQYQDMAGLLRNYGVQIDNYLPNQQAQVKIRGVFTSSPTDPGTQGGVLILVDGRRIGTNNISMIPMVNIERVEILRGPGAVQYGTSAIGGVINVITKRGAEQLSASALGGLGSWQTYKGQGSLSWAYGPFDFSGGISYMDAGDYFTGGYTPHKYHNTEMNGKFGYNVNAGFNFLEEHRIGVTALGTNTSHVGSPGPLYPGPFEAGSRREYLDISSYSADFLYEGGYRDWGLAWKGRYFLGREKHYNGFDDETPFDSPLRLTNDYQGAQGQLSFKKSFLTLTGGVDWLCSDGRKERSYYNYDEKYTNDNLGVFALAKIALFNDRLILSGGVRHDAYWLKTRGDESNSKNLDKTVPAFGVAVHPLEWLTLRGNYGESYRVPGSLELLGFKGSMYGDTLPNPDLKPEEAKSWDAGFEINHKSLKIGLNYFETEYKKKIVLNGTWDQYINADGKIWYKGFEGNASYDLGEAFDWPVKVRPYVNFTALTERKASRGSQWASSAGLGNKVPNVSDLELAYGLNFTYPDIGFEADVRFTYVGYQYNYRTHPVTFADEYERVGGKTTVDLFLRQRVFSSDKAGTFSVYGEIRNLANERIVLMRGYPYPGRSFFVGLRYDYN